MFQSPFDSSPFSSFLAVIRSLFLNRCFMKAYQPLKRPAKWLGLAFAALVALLAPPTQAHNLDTRGTAVYFADDFIGTMSTRAGLGQPLVQVGDKIWVIMKTKPGPGTTTGVGGYQTFYVPNGVKVVNAAYVRPVPTSVDPRGFTPISMKGQSPIAIGDGPIGAKTDPNLIGLTLPGVNGLGLNNAPVDAAGKHRGTIAGVYADTGIFYSTDPRTSFYTYKTPLTAVTPPGIEVGGTEPVMTNNSGDPVGEYDSAKITDPPNALGVTTTWDAYQEIGYGSKGLPEISVVDPIDQRGNAPWGLASAVAGPQSGYAWEFDYNAYKNTGGSKLARVQAALKIGPWKRIKYPGSQISKDQPGLISTTLGYAGIDASSMGLDLSDPANALERLADGTGVNAVRFAIGQLAFGISEYSAVQIQIVQPVAATCYRIYADSFGGDAGGTDNGKDHIWRYFDPNVVFVEPCVQLQKIASKPYVAPGETFSYKIVFANNGSATQPNIVLSDTLPSGLTFVSSSPAPTTSAAPTYTWNVGNVAPNGLATITVLVKVTGSGSLCNRMIATSGTTQVAVGEDCVEVGPTPLLVKSKSVTPTTVTPGGTVTYTVTVNNIGTGASGSPTVITDFLPTGFTYAAFVPSGSTINGAAFIPTIGGTSTQPTFTVSYGINVGSSLILKFTALVGSGVSPGSYCNGVELLHDGVREGPIPEACVTVGGGQIGDTVFRDWNGNGTQDAGEEGMPGVTVSLNGPGCSPCTATTGANGLYLFAGLQPGSYTVAVPSPGSGGVPSLYTLTADPDGGAATVSFVKVLAANEQFLGADWGYQPRGVGSIGDQIFNDKNGDGLFNNSDVGIPGAVVALYEDTNSNGVYDAGTDALVATTTSGSCPGVNCGIYNFPNLATGFSYLVYVAPTDPGVDAFFANPYLVTTPNPQSVLNLAGAYTAADIGWLENLPSSIGDEVFVDNNGNGIFDAGDEPLANITLTLYRDSNHDGVADGPAIATTSSDASGKYLFDNLGPDGYIVTVDTADPDLPDGLATGVVQYIVNLPSNTAFLTADFPFRKEISKTVDLATAIAGSTLNYTVTPYWLGPSLLTDASVQDSLPVGTTYVAASANAGGVFDNTTPPGALKWDLGSNDAAVPGITAPSGSAYCPAAPISLTAIDDTYITEKPADQTKNFGATPTMTSSSTKAEHKNLLIKFDLSSIPAGALVTKATLSLKGKNNPGGGKTAGIDIRNALTAWTEGTENGGTAGTGASWSDSNGSAAGDWVGNGLFTSASYSPESYGLLATKNALVTIDVASLVKKWLSTGINNGLVGLAYGTDTANFGWETQANGTAANRPTLTITYLTLTTPGSGTVACSNSSDPRPADADTYIDHNAVTKNFGTTVAVHG